AFMYDVIISKLDSFKVIIDGIKSNRIKSDEYFPFDSIIALQKIEFLRKYLQKSGFRNFSTYKALTEYLDSIFDEDDYLMLDINGFKVFVVWDMPRTAILGIADLNMYEKERYDALISINTSYGSMSLRSVPNSIDVSAIARKFNGDGHVNAAGGRSDLFKFDKFKHDHEY
ncbi:hypothetical protein, partial [Collinsella sp. Sow4_E3]|uniref:hypothetical protein n=1 Tax=Collinsella sp. Sow4_E3 TaxID=3438776 RepID=UPI003F8F9EEB